MKESAVFLLVAVSLFAGCCPTSPMPAGTADPDFVVDVYEEQKVWEGTTLLGDSHTGDNRVIEVNMLGEIVWEFVLPQEWCDRLCGLDTDPLPNGNILLVLTNHGIEEIDPAGESVWSLLDPQVSHDADRLPNGNTLYSFGSNDTKEDAQVKEVDAAGDLVWSWYAADHLDYPPYSDIFEQGWCHTNAVTRLDNGNTLISIRNFEMIVEVTPDGDIVDTIEDVAISPHDPEVLPNENILVVSQEGVEGNRAIEIDRETHEILWEYVVMDVANIPVRDCNRLPNGNTLITCAREIIEVTLDGEIVWRFRLADSVPPFENPAGSGFFKAMRLDYEHAHVAAQKAVLGSTGL